MSTATPPSGAPAVPHHWDTLADVLSSLGDVPSHRVRLHPLPGTATEQDHLEVSLQTDRLYELVDGTLLEKDMGFAEALLAGAILEYLRRYAREHDLGLAVGADGGMRLFPGLVRIPDVSFICWQRLPERKVPKEPYPDLAPDLAVEVLSIGNTRREMERKLREYFSAGVRLVWYIDPRNRTATAYSSPEHMTPLTEQDSLEGGEVLPGFALSLAKVLAELGE